MGSHFLRTGAVAVARKHLSRLMNATSECCYFPIRPLSLTSNLQRIVSFKLSDIGEGIREVTVNEWFVKVGDRVEQFDKLCEVQSDKASVTITSRYDGKISKIHKNTEEIALIGESLVDFDVEDDESTISSDSDSDSEEKICRTSKPIVPAAIESRLHALATPAVRRIAKEHKVDLGHVSPTGKNGRVLKGDVLEYLGLIPLGTNVPHPTTILKLPKQESTALINRTEKLKGVRKAMIKTMTEALKIPHFMYSDEIDMTKLIDFRDQLRDITNEHDIPKLTFMPFCIKAASIALAKFPILNSSLDLENESIIYKSAHNISVAVATPDGLVVPNIKNCQNKSIIEIASNLETLAKKARSGKLTPDDFADGTFTLSNVGIIGGMYTFPCVLTPQVSIGGIGKTKVVPRFNDKGEIVKAHIMVVSWVSDHRVVDGVTIANFSNLWKKYLENPALFLVSSRNE